VTLVDTGEETMTGGRVKRLEPWLRDGTFMVTYGDGVADIDLKALLQFHRSHGRIATVTAVRPPSRFGGLTFNGELVADFTEKPQIGEGWINGGFLVLEPGVFRYLEGFHDREGERQRQSHQAFIPAPNPALAGLGKVNAALVAFVQSRSPQGVATLDQDATLVETHKKEALYCYQGFKSYQPLSTYWAEQDLVIHSEFRDGNVPAGHEQLRVLQEALELLPVGVEQVRLRSDTAGYQQELLKYCAQGKHPKFGGIEFAVGVDVTPEFKKAVLEVGEEEWHPLERVVEEKRVKTHQEWAEVCFVPNWVGRSKHGPDYRFLAIREPLSQQLELLGIEGQQSLPFPTLELPQQGRYKLFGLVTNRDLPGEEVIQWHRQRCGKSEEAHGVLKEDLAGGQLPSGDFGENAAWWGITVLAFNLNVAMQRLVLGEGWLGKRLKAMRFGLISLPGRVVKHARGLYLRLSGGHPCQELLLGARLRILALSQGPPG